MFSIKKPTTIVAFDPGNTCGFAVGHLDLTWTLNLWSFGNIKPLQDYSVEGLALAIHSITSGFPFLSFIEDMALDGFKSKRAAHWFPIYQQKIQEASEMLDCLETTLLQLNSWRGKLNHGGIMAEIPKKAIRSEGQVLYKGDTKGASKEILKRRLGFCPDNHDAAEAICMLIVAAENMLNYMPACPRKDLSMLINCSGCDPKPLFLRAEKAQVKQTG